MKVFSLNRYNPTIIALVTGLALSLTACGGGSSGSSGGGNSGNDEESSSSSNGAVSNSTGCSSLTKEMFLKRINELRSKSRICHQTGKTFVSAPAVHWNNKLNNATSDFARDMEVHNYYDYFGIGDAHKQPNTKKSTNEDGRYNIDDALTVEDRVDLAGYKGIPAENLGIVFSTVDFSANKALDVVINQWLKSKEGHCEAIMNPKLKDFAMSCGYNHSSNKTSYHFVQMFGIPTK